MRRTALITICAASGLIAAALALPAVGAAEGKLASARVLSCSQADHSAVFQGRMTQIDGTDRMALRYTLLLKLPGQQETRVKVPGLGRWRGSKAGVGMFAYKQQVLNLTAGGSYRVRVEFRWFDAKGAVIRTTKRRSPSCKQSAPLPNLRIEVAGARPTNTAGIWRYSLRVGNDGSGSAGNVAVRLSVDGSVVDVTTVPLLDSGVWSRVVVRGPACEHWVDADVDTDAAIVESTEADNHARAACADVVRQ